MLKRIKSIHPGWFIAGFFAILITFNAVFFTIAATTPVHLVPRDAPKKSAVLEPAAAQPEAAEPKVDATQAEAPTPEEPTTPR